MKRMKALVCCAAAACLAMVLAGCSSQQSYTPPEKSATVSSPTIGKSGTLRVGVNAGSPPLAGSPSSSSKIVGIDVDVAAALADQLGLKLEIVDVGTDPEAALKEGKVDVAMGIGSESDVSFWRSPAYLPKGVALFSTPANATVPTKASSPKIAAQVSSTSSWQVTNEFGQDALVSESDLKSAFAALADGSAQYVAADAVIGMYAAHSGDYDAQIVALMQQPGGYCVGVLEANTELQAAVKDALAALTDGGIVSVIEKKWLGTDIDASSLPLTTGASSAKTDESKANGDGATSGDGSENAPAAEDDEEGNVEDNAGRNAVQPTA